MAKELVSFDDLKILLGLTKTEADYQQLTLIQESVADAIEEYCGRTFESDTYQETVTPISPSKMIPLKAIPVSSITSITIAGNDSTDFKIRAYGVELGSTVDNQEIIITYVGGLETVTPSLKRAALLQTTYEYQNKDNIGASFVTNEGGSVTVPEIGLLKEVRRLLKNERHILNRLL